jgi:hypothetical protein
MPEESREKEKGYPEDRPWRADRFVELLGNVVEVRGVVLGAAPSKGPILELKGWPVDVVSSSIRGVGVQEAEEQGCGSNTLQAASAGVSKNCAGQETLSVTTESLMAQEGRLKSSSGGVPGPEVVQEVGPLSPKTEYANLLDLVKQAMCKKQGSQALDVHIAAQLEQLRRKAQGPLQEEGREAMQEERGGKGEGIPEERRPCGDHSAELLARIVVEVRQVVLGLRLSRAPSWSRCVGDGFYRL